MSTAPIERLRNTQPMATGQKEDSERATEAPNPGFGATTSKTWKQRETAALCAGVARAWCAGGPARIGGTQRARAGGGARTLPGGNDPM